MIRMEGVNAGYGRAQVLFDMAIDVRPSEVVTLMGRNGMGKSTTLKTLFGLIKPSAGKITVSGREVTGFPPHQITRLGLGCVPEGRRIFRRLTVEENLVATSRPGEWSLSRIYEMFPRLKERRANLGNQLSGGEQQMLAIGRALMVNPSLLVLDEATEGLAPAIRGEIWATLRRLKNEGLAILIVDKNLDALIPLANRHFVIEKGQLVWNGTSAELVAQREHVKSFIEL
ncbi:MAG: ABC transporter ATP-binding protein [Hyphomicrobiales bacterium]|nr:ABC transporter ATP-binding protein [Hyphomicrobiales bacterium]